MRIKEVNYNVENKKDKLLKASKEALCESRNINYKKKELDQELKKPLTKMQDM